MENRMVVERERERTGGGGLYHFTHKDGHLHNPFGQL